LCTLKALFLVVSGLKKLKVESVTVNHTFLFSNGLLMVHWQVKNALWIRVQGKWVGCQDNHVLMYPADPATTLSICIRGLFGRYRKSFIVHPHAALAVPASPIFDPLVSRVSALVYSTLIVDLHPVHLVGIGEVVPKLPRVEILIPPYQTDHDYDKRLLHHP
jgi:hypothetical protein